VVHTHIVLLVAMYYVWAIHPTPEGVGFPPYIVNSGHVYSI